jgi:hypothetical protein
MAKQPTIETLPLDGARFGLARLWLIGVTPSFLIIVAQCTVGNVYQGRIHEVFAWLLPTFMPTLSLILSVLAATAVSQGRIARETYVVRKDFYSIVFWLSIAYLLLVLFTILIQPFSVAVNADPNFSAADVLKLSNLWLAPVQSLVVAAIGTLFFNKQEASAAEIGTKPTTTPPKPTRSKPGKAKAKEAEGG